MKEGLDLSFAHPDLGWWQRRYAEGKRVAVQCAWTGGYAGNDGIKLVCEDNLRNARLTGFECGAYANATPPTWWPDATAIAEIKANMGAEWAEVQHFIIDMEITGLTQARAFSLADALIAEGKTCDIGYTARWFFVGHMNNDPDPAWLRFKLLSANYDGNPDIGTEVNPYGPWTRAVGKQYAGTLNVDGFDVDLDVVADDFFTAATPTPEPTPIPAPGGDDDMTPDEHDMLVKAAALHDYFMGAVKPIYPATDPTTVQERSVLDQILWVALALDGQRFKWLLGESNFDANEKWLDAYNRLEKATEMPASELALVVGKAVTAVLGQLPAAQLTAADIGKIQSWAAKQ